MKKGYDELPVYCAARKLIIAAIIGAVPAELALSMLQASTTTLKARTSHIAVKQYAQTDHLPDEVLL